MAESSPSITIPSSFSISISKKTHKNQPSPVVRPYDHAAYSHNPDERSPDQHGEDADETPSFKDRRFHHGIA
jgi:hypothetical protein